MRIRMGTSLNFLDCRQNQGPVRDKIIVAWEQNHLFMFLAEY